MISVSYLGFFEVFPAFIAEIRLSDRDYAVRVAVGSIRFDTESIGVGDRDQEFVLEFICFRRGKKNQGDKLLRR